MFMRLLTGTAVVTLVLASANPARAEGVDLDLGGYFIGYGLYNNQDTTAGTSLRNINLRQNTKVEFEGEAKLDNGLTTGVFVEMDVDRADSGDIIDQSFGFVGGEFGQVNLGEADGAAALLQVEAPSADPYIDGMDPKINAFDISELGGGAALPDSLGYFQEPTETHAKIVYITPEFSGFQAAASFTPTVDDADEASFEAADQDDDVGEFENGIEIGARYEREVSENTSFLLGAGYSHLTPEVDDTDPAEIGSDDRSAYNVGATVTFGPATLGGSYVRDNNGIDQNGDTRIAVVGANYDVTEDVTAGLSYYDRTDESNFSGTTDDVDIKRYSAGAVYEFGPGMSFNGSVGFIDVEEGNNDGQGTQVAVGTNINF